MIACLRCRRRMAVDAARGLARPARCSAHLERCAACRSEWEALASLAAALPNVAALPGAPTLVVLPETAATSSRRARPLLLTVLGSAAAACAAIWIGVQALRMPPPRAPLSVQTLRPGPPATEAPSSSGKRGGAHGPAAPISTPYVPWPFVSPPSNPVSPQPAASTPPGSPVRDESYLDGRDPELFVSLGTGRAGDAELDRLLRQPLPPVKDDFVRVPLPRVAGSDGAAIAASLAAYAEQAKVVDNRLVRRLTLRQKAVSLAELCEVMEKETGVSLRASRGLADENVTVLVKDRPAREVMREVARLFGYYWSRSEREGEYRYELTQDLRSQLAEEQLRSRDMDAALLALDARMTSYGAELNLPHGEVVRRWEAAKGKEKERLDRFMYNSWVAVQVYNRMTPAQRSALARGEKLTFDPKAQDPSLRLPQELRGPLLDASSLRLEVINGQESIAASGRGDGRPLSALPEAMPKVSLSIGRSELGQLQLDLGVSAYLEGREHYGGGYGLSVASVRSPSVESPQNAVRNGELRKLPSFRRRVSWKPVSSCPHYAPGSRPDPETPDQYIDDNGELQGGRMPPHVFASDVWEAVHDATGLPIIADAYSRTHDQKAMTVNNRVLFDALCDTGDGLRVRWRKDGDYLLCRSTSYFWDKLKEVPRRQLVRWRRDAQGDGLPLSDVLEMTRGTEQQIASGSVGRVIHHCWKLPERALVAAVAYHLGAYYTEILPYTQVLAAMTPGELQAAQSEHGIAAAALRPAARDEIVRRLLTRGHAPEDLDGLVIRFSYGASGGYMWHPLISVRRHAEAATWPVVRARTRQEALERARRINSDVRETEIRASAGGLRIYLYNRKGLLNAFGDPMPAHPVSEPGE
jgi:hypothetical protein